MKGVSPAARKHFHGCPQARFFGIVNIVKAKPFQDVIPCNRSKFAEDQERTAWIFNLPEFAEYSTLGELIAKQFGLQPVSPLAALYWCVDNIQEDENLGRGSPG